MCGITRPEDGEAAVTMGADIIGFIFADSPRKAAVETVRSLGDLDVLKAGIVVMKPGETALPDEVVALMSDGVLDVIQFHGDEAPDVCSRMAFPYYKALRVRNTEVLKSAAEYRCPRVLLDAYSPDAHGGTGKRIEAGLLECGISGPLWLAGGLNPGNIRDAVEDYSPELVDVFQRSGNFARDKGPGYNEKIFYGVKQMTYPDYFGKFGGQYVAEVLRAPLEELQKEFLQASEDPGFWKEIEEIGKTYIGRPTPLLYAENATREIGGGRIYIKLEGLAQTGAHKINNAIGQVLLAARMGKKRIIAETGAGQHGVAVSAVCARMEYLVRSIWERWISADSGPMSSGWRCTVRRLFPFTAAPGH